MDRIMIIGCGGSGKSTLARQLGQITGIPVVHLDQIWWSPGNWQHLPREEFDRLLEAELKKPRWIMDGNFNRTMDMRLKQCDTVIYLDYNRFVCLLSWIKRVIAHWGTTRPDMAPGCAEWFDPDYIRWVWNFNHNYRAQYHARLSALKNVQVHIIRSRRQLRRMLKAMKTESS